MKGDIEMVVVMDTKSSEADIARVLTEVEAVGGQAFEAAAMARDAGAQILRGDAYKHRSSPYAFQGLAVQGLELLKQMSEATGMPTVTEVLEPADVEVVASYADMLRVGTRNLQNF